MLHSFKTKKISQSSLIWWAQEYKYKYQFFRKDGATGQVEFGRLLLASVVESEAIIYWNLYSLISNQSALPHTGIYSLTDLSQIFPLAKFSKVFTSISLRFSLLIIKQILTCLSNSTSVKAMLEMTVKILSKVNNFKDCFHFYWFTSSRKSLWSPGHTSALHVDIFPS